MNANGKGRLAVCAGVVAIAGLAVLLLAGSEEAQGWTVRIEHGEVEIDVSPNSTGASLNIVIIDSEEPYSQTFEVESTVGGSISVTPIVATVNVPPSSSAEQPLAVSALPRTSLQQHDCSVTVTRTHVAGVPDPTRPEESTGFAAVVLQFAEMNLTVEQESYTIDEGKRAQIEFHLTNSGNYIDGFSLSLRCLPGGWNVDYLSNKGLMLADESETIIVNLTAHDAKTARLRLVAKSHFNDSVMVCAEVSVKAEGEESWFWPWGAVGIGGAFGGMAAVGAVVVWQRSRGHGDRRLS